jgi:hypothetical protein
MGRVYASLYKRAPCLDGGSRDCMHNEHLRYDLIDKTYANSLKF